LVRCWIWARTCVRIHGREVRSECRPFGTTTGEATGSYWKSVWHLLEGSFELLLANAAHVRNVPGRKSDVNDATWLADLLAHGLIRGSLVPPAPIQELRDLTRTRKQLKREIVQHTQRIERVLDEANLKVTGLITGVRGVSGKAIIQVDADSKGAKWLKTLLIQAA